jgi:aspartyl-tRNA(Asn)/glutamyl-tRNA(Gln) amidotransferase subunit C
MSLTPDDVRRIARLARIAIEPEESFTVLEGLNRVLELVGEMRKVDTAGIEPMAHALDLVQRLRSDEAKEGDQRSAYQAVAPAGSDGNLLVSDGLYLVPKVIE